MISPSAGDVENPVYASLYTAESIFNWRVERINGRNVTTMVGLTERGTPSTERGAKDGDEFVEETI